AAPSAVALFPLWADIVARVAVMRRPSVNEALRQAPAVTGSFSIIDLPRLTHFLPLGSLAGHGHETAPTQGPCFHSCSRSPVPGAPPRHPLFDRQTDLPVRGLSLSVQAWHRCRTGNCLP